MAERLKKLVIDLTPLLPGGANGGLGLLAINLAREFALLVPDCQFVWLTADDTHETLALFESPNITRKCVYARAPQNAIQTASLKHKLRLTARETLKSILPAAHLAKLKSVYRRHGHSAQAAVSANHPLLLELGADLLFCPFTAPFYAHTAIPTVSVVVDLQYLAYPQFFSADDFYYRDTHFRQACQTADRLVCISDYVRQTVLAQSQLPEHRVTTISIGLSQHVKTPAANGWLTTLGLTPQSYYVYPANFWQHKNHEMLLTAWGLWNAAHPHANLKLVLTGAPNERQTFLRAAINQMGLGDKVILPGYLADEQFAALLHDCRSMIFPSLYEGFGMPVVEAMALGKPVLCSNVTSLPEVGGNAVLTFDPRKPEDMVKAISRLEHEAGLASQLIERGYKQAARFGNSESMAKQYLELFQDVIASRQQNIGL